MSKIIDDALIDATMRAFRAEVGMYLDRKARVSLPDEVARVRDDAAAVNHKDGGPLSAANESILWDAAVGCVVAVMIGCAAADRSVEQNILH